MSQHVAPDGMLWVCHACGKTAIDRIDGGMSRGWDSSCYVSSQLHQKSNLTLGEDGRVIAIKEDK